MRLKNILLFVLLFSGLNSTAQKKKKPVKQVTAQDDWALPVVKKNKQPATTAQPARLIKKPKRNW
jgi:hypothetical protein